MMESVLVQIQTVVTFLVIFAVLVFFHELGHFGVAKLFKMRVEEFALGFGPRLLRVGFDGQTEYNIRAVPLGGFVRIAGMEVEDAAERRLTGSAEKKPADSETQTTNAVLMEQEAAEVHGEDPDGFNSRPIHQRFLVILAGPVFSLALAWLAFCLIGSLYGLPRPGAKPTTRIAAVYPDKPAARAGLKAGDTIVAIDGVPMTDGAAMIDVIHAAANKPLRLTVRGPRGDATRDVTVTPQPQRVEGKEVGLIGMIPAVPTARVGVAESFSMGTRVMGAYLDAFVSLFKRGLSKDDLSGPIGIVKETRRAVDAGGSSSLELLAQLSFSIGLFNLLPIPMLDGGHLALITLEGVRGRKLTAEQTQRVLATGLAIIAFLFVWVMFNDITKLFRRG